MTQLEKVSFDIEQTGLFSALMEAYQQENESLRGLVRDFSSPNSLADYGRKKSFPSAKRKLLVEALLRQYQANGIQGHEECIQRLSSTNAFTVCTGHQLNLFGGPLFTLYKIQQVINTCKSMQETEPSLDWVPVFWMASEDHDFEEIATTQWNDRTFQWEHPSASGPVGRIETTALKPLLNDFITFGKNQLGAHQVLSIIEEAYSKHSNLAQATRYWVHQVFGHSGLIVIDGDDAALKQSASALFKQELFDEGLEQLTSESCAKLKKEFHLQVNPRPINLFYIADGVRQRIVSKDSGFATADQSIHWTEKEMQALIEEDTSCLSPNAIFRPLYQESILPNLMYVGGGGELAYWLQLKAGFEGFGLEFPLLQLRDSFHLVDDKIMRRLKDLGVSPEEYFQSAEDWVKRKVLANHERNQELEQGRAELRRALDAMLASLGDSYPELEQSLHAEKARMERSFKRLEKKISRGLKGREKDKVEALYRWHNALWGGSLQERSQNILSLWTIGGEALWSEMQQVSPWPGGKFHLISIKH